MAKQIIFSFPLMLSRESRLLSGANGLLMRFGRGKGIGTHCKSRTLGKIFALFVFVEKHKSRDTLRKAMVYDGQSLAAAATANGHQ